MIADDSYDLVLYFLDLKVFFKKIIFLYFYFKLILYIYIYTLFWYVDVKNNFLKIKNIYFNSFSSKKYFEKQSLLHFPTILY
jgi:hypothetical protein